MEGFLHTAERKYLLTLSEKDDDSALSKDRSITQAQCQKKP